MTILLLSNSADVTADYLEGVLKQHRGRDVIRLDSDRFPGDWVLSFDLSGGPLLHCAGYELRARSIGTIILRRPKALATARLSDPAEAAHVNGEWNEAVEGFLAHVPRPRWINHPADNVIASHKLEQLSRAARFGLRVPDTLVTQNRDEALSFLKRYAQGIVAKPLHSGYLERRQGRDSIIYTNAVTTNDLNSEPSLRLCPTLFQVQVRKSYDVRVTVVDKQLTSVKLLRIVGGAQILDIRRDNMADVEYELINIPDDVRKPLMDLLRSYCLRFAAVDFVVDVSGEWYFLEINPSGQWAWLDLCANARIGDAFALACESA